MSYVPEIPSFTDQPGGDVPPVQHDIHIGDALVSQRTSGRFSLQQLGNMCATYFGVESETLRPYVGSMDQLYASGWSPIDATARDALSEGRKITLAQLVSQYKLLNELSTGGPGKVRKHQPEAFRGLTPAQIAAHPLNAPWRQSTLDNAEAGYYRSQVLRAVSVELQLMLAPEMALTEQERERMAMSALPGLPADNSLSHSPLTFTQAAELLRSQGAVDLSRSTLDARMDGFVALARVEIPALAVGDIFELMTLGGKYAEKALAIHKAYGKRLVAEPYTSYMALSELSAFAGQAARRTQPHERALKKVLAAMATRSGATVAHMERMRQLFMSVYDTLDTSGAPSYLVSIATPFNEPPAPETDPVAVPEVAEAEVAVGGIATAVALREALAEKMFFEKLEVVVFPNTKSGINSKELGEGLERVAKDIADTTEGADEGIILNRLYDLSALGEAYDGQVFISKKNALSSKFPYLLCFFTVGEQRFCIAETPVHRHATYVLAEDALTDTIINVLEMRRTEARQAGAVPIRHSVKYPNGPQHQQKVHNAVFQLSVTKPRAT